MLCLISSETRQKQKEEEEEEEEGEKEKEEKGWGREERKMTEREEERREGRRRNLPLKFASHFPVAVPVGHPVPHCLQARESDGDCYPEHTGWLPSLPGRPISQLLLHPDSISILSWLSHSGCPLVYNGHISSPSHLSVGLPPQDHSILWCVSWNSYFPQLFSKL